MIDAKMTLDLQKNGIQKTVHCMSGESEARRLIITLTNNGKVFDPASYDAVAIFEDETGTIGCRADVAPGEIDLILPTLEPGEYIFELAIGDESSTMFSPFFRVIAEQSFDVPADGEEPEVAYKIIIVGENNYLTNTEAEAFALKEDTYSIEETDELLNDKADVDNIYSKAQVDNAISAKANVSDVYAKADTYNKTELDKKLSIAGGFVPVKMNSDNIEMGTYTLADMTHTELIEYFKKGNGVVLYSNDFGYTYNLVIDIDYINNGIKLYTISGYSGAEYIYEIKGNAVTSKNAGKSLISNSDKTKLENIPAEIQAKLTAGTGISIDPDTNEIACTVTGGDGGGVNNINESTDMSPLKAGWENLISEWYSGKPLYAGQNIVVGISYDYSGEHPRVYIKAIGKSSFNYNTSGLHKYAYDPITRNPVNEEYEFMCDFEDIGNISAALAEIRTIINGGNS